MGDNSKPQQAIAIGRMIKVAEVAAMLAISPSKVYELVDCGKLPHHRFDGAIRISESQLAEFLSITKREQKSEADMLTSAPGCRPLRRLRL